MSFQRSGGRNAPSPHSLNKNSDFYDKFGQLKDGYSYDGGEGMIAMGEGKVGTTRGAGKDGMVGGTINKMIYGKATQKSEHKPTIASEATSTPEAKPTTFIPVEYQYSPEIQQAQDRVSAYKNKALLGDISAQIYNSSDFTTKAEQIESFLDNKKYQFKSK